MKDYNLLVLVFLFRTSSKKPRYNFDNDDEWVCGDELDSPVKIKKPRSHKKQGKLLLYCCYKRFEA